MERKRNVAHGKGDDVEICLKGVIINQCNNSTNNMVQLFCWRGFETVPQHHSTLYLKLTSTFNIPFLYLFFASSRLGFYFLTSQKVAEI